MSAHITHCSSYAGKQYKFSYRRDSARLSLLSLLRSFKVIDFDTNQVRDFISVNNTKLHIVSRTVYQLLRNVGLSLIITRQSWVRSNHRRRSGWNSGNGECRRWVGADWGEVPYGRGVSSPYLWGASWTPPAGDFGVFWRQQKARSFLYLTKYALASPYSKFWETCPPPPWSTPMALTSQ